MRAAQDARLAVRSCRNATMDAARPLGSCPLLLPWWTNGLSSLAVYETRWCADLSPARTHSP